MLLERGRARVCRNAERDQAMFVHESVAAVAASAADTMFGLIGDANLFMVNAFVEQHGGRYVSAVHEASAVMMAHGYSARSGRLGVATVTQGPGLTNAATALIEAARSGTPLVVITGDTAPGNLLNQQTLDQEPFVRAAGAGYVLVQRPADAAGCVRQAIAAALGESRPVVLDCPTEYQWDQVEFTAAAVLPARPAIPDPGDDQLDAAVGVIASAHRPLVLAGHGVVASGARDAVLAFARRIGAPLATTLRARGLYRADEGSVGVMGTVSAEKGSQVIADADCIIAFGASLNTWTTSRNTLLAGKAVVQVDTDAACLGRTAAVAAAVHGDAASVAAAFGSWLDEGAVPASPFRDRATAGLVQADLAAAARPGTALTLAGALSQITAALPEQRTVVFDGGRFLGEAFAHVHSPDPGRQVLTTSFGAVGLGMGAAIGAACAARDEPTLFITGDGGFMMNGLAELHSAIRQDIPLIVVICNDGSYGAEYDQYVNKGVKTDLSLFSWPSFPAVARSLGADGYAVQTADQLPAALEAVRAQRRHVVIDVRIGPADVPEVAH
jgi:acetolactate synthase-1/2/3 large subunit